MTTMLVRDLMSENPFTATADTSLAALYDIMVTRNIRHVPIVETDGCLVGLVSHRDLMRGMQSSEVDLPLSAQRDLLRSFAVEDIMTREPEAVDPEDDLRVAADMILDNKYGCVPVVDGDRLVGILTESDFVRYVRGSLAEPQRRAATHR